MLILDKLIRASTVFTSNPEAFIFISYCKALVFTSLVVGLRISII